MARVNYNIADAYCYEDVLFISIVEWNKAVKFFRKTLVYYFFIWTCKLTEMTLWICIRSILVCFTSWVFIIVVSSHNMTAVISMPFVYTFLIITSHRLPTAINVSTLAFSKVSSIQEVFFVKWGHLHENVLQGCILMGQKLVVLEGKDYISSQAFGKVKIGVGLCCS